MHPLFIPHLPYWFSDSPGHQKVNLSSRCILWVTPLFSRILSFSLMPRARDSLTQALGNEILWEYKKIHHPRSLPIAVISSTTIRNNLERKGFIYLRTQSLMREGRVGTQGRIRRGRIWCRSTEECSLLASLQDLLSLLSSIPGPPVYLHIVLWPVLS